VRDKRSEIPWFNLFNHTNHHKYAMRKKAMNQPQKVAAGFTPFKAGGDAIL